MKKILVFLLSLFLCSSIFITPCYAEDYLYLNRSQANLEVNNTIQLFINLSPKYILWSSSNKSVADVSQDGTVTAIAAGQATVTANIYELKLDCYITVSESQKKVLGHITADRYISVLPLSDRVNIKISDYQLSETNFRISTLNNAIVSCSWGEAKDNSIPLIFTPNKSGCTIIFIQAEYKDGTEESIALHVISLGNDVLIPPII
jgi:hypothetical protein